MYLVKGVNVSVSSSVTSEKTTAKEWKSVQHYSLMLIFFILHGCLTMNLNSE